jgi:UrcA family protein
MGLVIASAFGLTASTASLAAERAEGAHTLTVRYTAADVSTIDGARTLYERIRGAARFVCGDSGRTLWEQRTWQSCYRGAVESAVSEVNSPLLETVHHQQGSPGPVTAMLKP